MHLHVERVDFMVVLTGRVTVALKDMRGGSPTEGANVMVPLSRSPLDMLVVPPGISHGYVAHADTMLLYGLTTPYDGLDELGMRYDDPDLGIKWPISNPIVSTLDEGLPPVRAIKSLIPAYGTYDAAVAPGRRDRSSE